MSTIFTKFGDTTAIVLVGGPVQKISVNGKIYTFEWHPYCGPTALKRNGDPLAKQPTEFLEAATFWNKQGREMENGLCVWYREFEPEPITEHIGGRHWKLIGYKPAKPKERGF